MWIAAVSAILLVAFGVRLGHMAAVEHGVCEHGELTHVHPGGLNPSASASSDRGPRATEGATAREDAHEHCTSLAVHYRLPTIAAHTAQPTLLGVLSPRAPAAVEERPPLDALALAPKNSPPRG